MTELESFGWSLLHPWIVPGVGIHGRATAIDGFGAQFVVPGFVPVDPAEPVPGAVSGQPRRGAGGPDVDRVSRHMRRRVRSGHPSGSVLFRAVLRDRVTKQLFLILRGAPATVDDDLDPVPCGVRCRVAEGTEQTWIEVGHGRTVVVEDRHAARDGAIASPSGRWPVTTPMSVVLTTRQGQRGWPIGYDELRFVLARCGTCR